MSAQTATVEIARAPRREPVSALRRRLRYQVGEANDDFRMICAGDRMMACQSGGKDCYVMLSPLLQLPARPSVRFDLVAVNRDQKQPGFPAHVLPNHPTARGGVPHHRAGHLQHGDAGDACGQNDVRLVLTATPRRAVPMGGGKRHHAVRSCDHRDDALGTFFLNRLYQAQLDAMPPELHSDDGRYVMIRPLAYCAVADLAEYAAEQAFPIIPCTLCGSQENLQRRAVSRMLAKWEREQPRRVENISHALRRVSPSQLGDRELCDFATLERLASPTDAQPFPSTAVD